MKTEEAGADASPLAALMADMQGILARLDANDKAVAKLAEYPTEVDKAVASLRELQDQRFTSIEEKVELRGALVPMFHQAVTEVAVLTSRLDQSQLEVERRVTSLREATALALSSVEKATSLSQSTADKAVAKAEAAASQAYLEQIISAVRDNFGEQIVSLKESLATQMAAAKEAVSKAEAATEKRFEGVNEFRAQLQDQAARFMPRMEAEAWSRSNAEKIDTLAGRLDRAEGRSSGFASSGTVIASSVAILAGLVTATVAILAFNT